MQRFDKTAAFNRINQQLTSSPTLAKSQATDNTNTDKFSIDPQGYEPVYRSRKTVDKRMSRNQSRELLREQKSWNDSDTNSMSPSANNRPANYQTSMQLSSRDNKKAAVRRQEA